MIRLFDIHDGKLVPTEHCYAISFLKNIMDEYPTNYITVYKYIFYMTCPDPQLNPFFNVPEEDKESLILDEIEADFSTEDELIIRAKDRCNKLFETPTVRSYRGMATMMDRLARYMETTPISHGRDGNINSLVAAAKNFEGIRTSFKGVYKDLQEEQKNHVRGGAGLAYDQ
tara:strand:+ start:21 stop:533 length:513 start_codon:yes stop_codon:yes gene_type:complete